MKFELTPEELETIRDNVASNLRTLLPQVELAVSKGIGVDSNKPQESTMSDWLKDFEQRIEVAQRYDERVCLEPDQARELIDAMRDRNNILARIHRDGGHYVEQHGIVKAVTDADSAVSNLHALLEQVESVVSTIEKAEYVNGESMSHEGARSVASHLLAELAEIKGK